MSDYMRDYLKELFPDNKVTVVENVDGVVALVIPDDRSLAFAITINRSELLTYSPLGVMDLIDARLPASQPMGGQPMGAM